MEKTSLYLEMRTKMFKDLDCESVEMHIDLTLIVVKNKIPHYLHKKKLLNEKEMKQFIKKFKSSDLEKLEKTLRKLKKKKVK